MTQHLALHVFTFVFIHSARNSKIGVLNNHETYIFSPNDRQIGDPVKVPLVRKKKQQILKIIDKNQIKLDKIPREV